MADYRVISADNHVAEPADLWTTRAEIKFRDRAPRIESLDDGDYWFCDGEKIGGLQASGGNVGLRFEEREKLSTKFREDEIRPGGYIPSRSATTSGTVLHPGPRFGDGANRVCASFG